MISYNDIIERTKEHWDGAIDDVENDRVISEEELWAEIDAI